LPSQSWTPGIGFGADVGVGVGFDGVGMGGVGTCPPPLPPLDPGVAAACVKGIFSATNVPAIISRLNATSVKSGTMREEGFIAGSFLLGKMSQIEIGVPKETMYEYYHAVGVAFMKRALSVLLQKFLEALDERIEMAHFFSDNPVEKCN